MKKEKITIVDVAKLLKVSTSTVSRALNDHHSISEKTKQKVRKAAEELNYSPNNVAASLRSGKVNSIGVIIPKINSTFMSNCIFGIESVTYPAGYNLIICQSNENFEKEVDNIQALIDSQVSGIMLSLSHETFKNNHLKKVIDKNIPLVMFDRISEVLEIDSVVNDDFKITIDAIEHLYKNNYKKIAIISGPTHIFVYKNRMLGYLEALKNFQLEKNDAWIFEGIKTKQEAQQTIETLYENEVKPDAIFCTGDMLALGVLQALKNMNIQVPNEVGVIGYSNDNFAEITQPTLTSIEQYPQDIGANAANIMLDLIKNKSAIKNTAHKKIYIKPSLIIRESSDRTKVKDK
jgi:LacI family transcriptional regulator